MRRDSRLSGVLHVLLHMAEHPGPMTSKMLARAMGTNPVVIRRLMAGLRERGFVQSEKGHGGGWTIACDLATVTLLDVYEALGRPELLAIGNRTEAPGCLVEQAVNAALGDAFDEAEALRRVSAQQVRLLLRPALSANVDTNSEVVLARGEAASPGAGFGIIVEDADEAERIAATGQPVVLSRPTTSPEDVHGMFVAQAVITERGGSTSHAAVVSRQLGVPCIVGCGDGALQGLVGRTVTIDGNGGYVLDGQLRVDQPQEDADPFLRQLRDWAKARSPLGVHAAGQAPQPPAVNLESDDASQVSIRLQGVKSAVGSLLNTDEGVQLAVTAGLDFIVVKQVLPALLAACAATKNPANAPTPIAH